MGLNNVSCEFLFGDSTSECYNASVIRQKGESQNGCFKKTMHAEFSKKQTLLTTVRFMGQEMLVFRENWRAVFLKCPF